MKKLNLTGQRFGKIEILSQGPNTKRGNITWIGKCDCGTVKNFYSGHLRRGLSTSCGCSAYNRCKKNHVKWKGCGDISGNYWCCLTRNGNGTKGRKPKEFTITVEYIWDLFLKQERKCALSGLPLTINYRGNRYHPNNPNSKLEHTASLDRIDSSKGYIEGNVQWIHKQINIMKNNLSDTEFINWCLIIGRYQENKLLQEI